MLRQVGLGIGVGVVWIWSCGAAAPQTTGVRLLPRDEAATDPTFLQFRTRLMEIAKIRDRDALLRIADPEMKVGSGAEILRVLGTGPADVPMWQELAEVLRLGGTFTTTRGAQDGRREFCAPYVYSAYPSILPPGLQGEGQPWVVLGENVAVRTRQDPTAPVMARLSYELVKAGGWLGVSPDRHKLWAQIDSGPARGGYVSGEWIRDPLDYHACFAKTSEGWRMSLFARGRSPG